MNPTFLKRRDPALSFSTKIYLLCHKEKYEKSRKANIKGFGTLFFGTIIWYKCCVCKGISKAPNSNIFP